VEKTGMLRAFSLEGTLLNEMTPECQKKLADTLSG